jgi:molybdate transport system substrate-binding protein
VHRHRRFVGTTLVIAAVAAAGLTVGARAASRSALTVFAASSLTDVFPTIDPGERYSFAGSNTLAAQIRQGAPADVFASANTRLPVALHAAGLCSKPVVFTRNALVIVVPKRNPAGIHSVLDLTRHGVKLDVAAPGVPVGDYTLQVLATLHLSTKVSPNVVSRETNVREVLAKVALGEADAGFVYSTDARTVRGRVRVIKLPARARPGIRYGMCVVAASNHRADGRAFVRRVLGKAGQAKLIASGFLPRVAPS